MTSSLLQEHDVVERRHLGSRIGEVVSRHFDSRDEAAIALKISKSTLERYISGNSRVDFEVVSRLSRISGIGIQWFASGHGNGDPHDISPGIPGEIVFRGAKYILTAVQYLGLPLAPEEVARPWTHIGAARFVLPPV